MGEKVLGFRARDAFESERNCRIIEGCLERQSDLFYEIEASKLVPVVSLEWLEQWVRKHQFSEGQVTDLVLGLELVRAARRQAGEGK